MKIISFILAFGIAVVSCNNTKQSPQTSALDTVGVRQAKANVTKDTTIEYNIEGISAEGASAKAKYIAGSIKECQISIYGETGQTQILYVFSIKKIEVSEKQLTYKGSLENTKSDKDMKVKKEISYVLDFDGKTIGKADNDRTDIFSEFKKTVPFEIK